MRHALAPLVEGLPEGIARLELPTPFPIGTVNCYLLLEHPITLIDPGMLWADTQDRIESELASHGLRVEHVEAVVVSHGHPDHFGAAGWVTTRAGAPIFCGRPEQSKLLRSYRDQPGSMQHLMALVDDLGVPSDVQRQFPSFIGMVAPLLHPVRDRELVPLDDMATLSAGGRSWEVHLTPGHSVGHVSLFNPETRTLLGGDHLLADVTPNPLIEPDETAGVGRRRSLIEYLSSLDRFVGLAPEVVLPGHGPAFTDLETWSDGVRRHHEVRAAEVLEAVSELGSPTAFQLSCRLFPAIEGFSHMLGMSEVLGHLDILAESGEILFVGTDPTHFEVT